MRRAWLPGRVKSYITMKNQQSPNVDDVSRYIELTEQCAIIHRYSFHIWNFECVAILAHFYCIHSRYVIIRAFVFLLKLASSNAKTETECFSAF